MNKKIILAQSLKSIADELDENGLSEEAIKIDKIINALSEENKMKKSSQFIPNQYRDQAIGGGAGLGAATGFGVGWNANKGNLISKLGTGLIGAGVGTGLGLAAGTLATESTGIYPGDPNAIRKIDEQIFVLTRKLEDLKRMRAALSDENKEPELYSR